MFIIKIMSVSRPTAFRIFFQRGITRAVIVYIFRESDDKETFSCIC